MRENTTIVAAVTRLPMMAPARKVIAGCEGDDGRGFVIVAGLLLHPVAYLAAQGRLHEEARELVPCQGDGAKDARGEGEDCDHDGTFS